MPVAARVTEYSWSADGRQIVFDSRTLNKAPGSYYFVLRVDAASTLGGGEATLQVTEDVSPDAATDAQWQNLLDKDGNSLNLMPGRSYAIQDPAVAFAINVSGSSSPNFTVRRL